MQHEIQPDQDNFEEEDAILDDLIIEKPLDPGKPEWILNIDPREVQIEALNKGYAKPGFAYFLRQRLGKSYLAYNEYKKLQKEGLVDWFFLICPNSIKLQWKEAIEEIDEFEPIHIYRANSKKHTQEYFRKNKSGGVFIINYESVRSFMDNEGWMLLQLPRTYLVADESTKIKSPKAKMTKACLELSKLCSYRRVLTGKPIANNNCDYWAQLDFIGATKRNFHQHQHTFTVYGGYLNKQVIKNVGTHILQREVEPYSYIAPDKYLKGFEKVYEPLRKVTLTGDLLKQYKDMEDDFVLYLASGEKVEAQIVLTKYLRLQQISSGITGDENKEQHNLIEPIKNPRIKVLLDILNSEITNKVIIACRFRLSISNIEEVLRKNNIKFTTLVGGLSPKVTEERKKEFNNGDTNVLIAQLQVLAYGHTLSGNDLVPCDSMIFYETDFSLMHRMQAESRPEKSSHLNAVVLDSEKVPISYYDMYASKMDRYIMEALRRKEEFSLAIMGYRRETGLRPKIEEKQDAYDGTNNREEDEEDSNEIDE